MSNRPIGCVYKTGSKYASKDEIELAVFESYRELRLAVRVFGLRLAVWLGKLLDGFSLVHTVIYGAHKQEHNKEKEIKVLPLSSKQEKLRYGGRKNIFGRFPNGTAEFILEMAWSNFGRIGGCLAHEMMG